MTRITGIFNNLKQQNKKAFIPFITAGDGGLDLTLEIMFSLVDNGADIIELGVPFSDPMADGEVIAKSHQRAVNSDVGLDDVFQLVTEFREKNQITAVVLMGYLNPIEIYGYEAFVNNANLSAIDGVLVVDMPPEEATELKQHLDNAKIDFIFLISPTTTNERLQYLANFVSGFVYFVSLKGVTGSGDLDIDLVNYNLTRVKQFITLPICIGFGVKNANSAKLVSQNADGVIVGSSLVAFIEKYVNDRVKMLSSIVELSIQVSGALK